MAKAELGTKRTDPDTGKKFYDLNKDPIVSPYTGKSWPLSYFEETSAASVMEKAEEEEVAEVDAETVYLAHFGAARPGPREIFDRAADSLERWHRSFLKKLEQTDSEEDLSRQFNACLEASLEPIAPSVRRDLESVSPAWLNLAGLSAEQARLGGRLSDAA